MSVGRRVHAPCVFFAFLVFGFEMNEKERRIRFRLIKLLCDPSRLDCSNNQLKELPSSLGRCSDLSEFKVMLHLG